MRLLLHLLLLCATILLLALTSACSTTPVQPIARTKPTTCFLTLPPILELLPPGFEGYSPHDKAIALLDLHQHDGATYAQALTQLKDCQEYINQ